MHKTHVVHVLECVCVFSRVWTGLKESQNLGLYLYRIIFQYL